MPIDLSRRPWPHRAILGTVGALGAACACLVAAGAGPADGAVSLRMAFVRASTELAQRFEADGADEAARVTLGPGGRDLRLAGDLTEGVSARVASLLADHPGVERVHLTSGGGLVEEGLALGGLVAEHGLATYVPDECASACTLVFVRGRARYLGTGGRLGFHAPYEAGLFRTDLRGRLGPRARGLPGRGHRPRTSPPRRWRSPPTTSGSPRPRACCRPASSRRSSRPIAFRTRRWTTIPARRRPARRFCATCRSSHTSIPPSSSASPAGIATATPTGAPRRRRSTGLRRRAAAHLRQLFRTADDATVRALGHAALMAMREAAAGGGDACDSIAGGDVVVIEETLRSARHTVPSLAALIAQARRPGGSVTEARTDGSAVPQPRRLARRGPARCGTRIEILRHALDRPVREAASALRTLLLDEAQPEVAGIASP